MHLIVSIPFFLGYGFINPSDGGNELYLGRSALLNPHQALTEGQLVSYEVTGNKEKTWGIDVRVIGDASPRTSGQQQLTPQQQAEFAGYSVQPQHQPQAFRQFQYAAAHAPTMAPPHQKSGAVGGMSTLSSTKGVTDCFFLPVYIS